MCTPLLSVVAWDPQTSMFEIVALVFYPFSDWTEVRNAFKEAKSYMSNLRAKKSARVSGVGKRRRPTRSDGVPHFLTPSQLCPLLSVREDLVGSPLTLIPSSSLKAHSQPPTADQIFLAAYASYHGDGSLYGSIFTEVADRAWAPNP
ncbi:hypothetical protein PHJA_002085200 [Phtheirospermum japonicum]|uniref:Uncharacterized protein n=1 Tax=Phtheirospermum japonicum TaxID=374723 RepID=A0A830CZ75_9LAMI|nr:hypothetical protein PHJA_002085200 [Phtheirospermum japonicum]